MYIIKRKLLDRLSQDPLKDIDNGEPTAISESRYRLQLKKDVIDLVEGRVSESNFEPKYLQKIKDFYRFGPRVSTSKKEEGVKKPAMSKNVQDLL